jgi:hypothetical protein
MSATTTAMTSTTLRKRAINSSSEVNVTNEGRKTDELLDSHTRSLHFLSQPAPTSHGLYQVGIRRTMGRHRHDGRVPDAHVLSVDMSLVL